MFRQVPFPGPHGSASHSFTSGKNRRREAVSRGCLEASRPRARPAALTHAVAVLRVRPVAGVAVAGVVGGARDALSVATDVLVQSALVGLWGHRQPRELSREHLPRPQNRLRHPPWSY